MATRPKKFFAAQDFGLGRRRIRAGDELSEFDAVHVSSVRPDLVTDDGPKAAANKKEEPADG